MIRFSKGFFASGGIGFCTSVFAAILASASLTCFMTLELASATGLSLWFPCVEGVLFEKTWHYWFLFGSLLK
jgi:hypothetical protein